MSKLLKILLGLLGILVVLFVALVAAVALLVEPNDYRPYLVDAVESATGRPFDLDGDLGLEFLPCCSVSLEGARLGNPPGFGEAEFARIGSASASLRLWPLLVRQEVAVGTVTLRGLEVSLVRQEDGQVNWLFEPDEAAEEPPVEDSAGPDIGIEALVLEDGRIRYQDAQAGTEYLVRDLNVETGALSLDADRLAAGGIVLDLVAEGDDLPGGEARLRVETASFEAGLASPDTTPVAIAGLDVTAAVLDAEVSLTGGGSFGTPGSAVEGTLTLAETSLRELLDALSESPFEPADASALRRLAAEGQWRFAEDIVSISDLTITLDDSNLTGSGSVSLAEPPAARFQLAADRLDLDRYLPAEPSGAEPAVSQGSDPAGEPVVVPLDALAGVDLEVTVTAGALVVSKAELADVRLALTSRAGEVTTEASARAGGGRLEVAGSGPVTGNDPRLAGSLSITGVSPRTLLTAMEALPATADPDVLSSFAGSARWTLRPQSAAVEEMRWQLDATTLTGSARVDDFDSMAVGFDLTLDRMNLDAYMPPDEAEAEEPAGSAEIPVELIRDLRLDGRLRAGELVLLGMTLRDLLAQVRAEGGVLRLAPLTASLYGGQYRGTVVVDATGPRADLTLEQSLEAVQVSEILGTFFDTDLLAGSLSLELSGSGEGNTPQALLETLAANVSFDLADGVYRGADLLYELRKARATLKNEAAPAPPESPETAIESLAARGSVQDGVLQTPELSAASSALRLTGRGGIDLLKLALDYQLEARIPEAGAEAARLGDLSNVPIPLTLTGPLSSPRVGVDLKGLLTGTLRETVQQKARSELLERLGGDREETPAPEAGAAEPDAAAPEPEQAPEKPSSRDLLRQGLRDLLKPRPEKEPPEEADGGG